MIRSSSRAARITVAVTKGTKLEPDSDPDGDAEEGADTLNPQTK